MKKVLKITGIVLGVFVGLYLIVAVSLQIALKPSVLQKIITRYEHHLIDGNLEFSNLEISVFENFPFLSIDLDDVAITYPDTMLVGRGEYREGHELLSAGRSKGDSDRDTLAAFSCLQATINIMSLWNDKQIDLPVIRLEEPRIFCHRYPDGSNSLDVVKALKAARLDTTIVETVDTTDTDLPDMKFGKIELVGYPVVVATNVSDRFFFKAGMASCTVGDDIQLAKLLDAQMHEFTVSVDSLYIQDEYHDDIINIYLDKVNVMERDSLYGVFARVNSYASLGGNTTEVPITVNGSVVTPEKGNFKKFHINALKVDLAELPVQVSGDVDILDGGSVKMNVKAEVKEFKIHDLVSRVDDFLPIDANQIGSRATFALKATANGTLSSNTIPLFNADCVVRHIDVDSPKDSVVVYVDSLGINAYHRKAKATDLVPAGLDMLGFVVKSDSLNFNYKNAAVVSGRNIELDGQTGVRILYENFSEAKGDVIPAYAMVKAANLMFMGIDSTRIAVRGTENVAQILPRQKNSKAVQLSVKTSNEAIVASSPAFGFSFIRSADANLILEYIKNDEKTAEEKAKAQRDSIAMVKRQSGALYVGNQRTRKQAERQVAVNSALKQHDLKFDFSESVKKFMNDWAVSGDASIRRVMVRSPFFPLATSLSRAKISFNNDNLSLESFNLRAGSSALKATGKITGIKSFINNQDASIGVNLDVKIDSLHATQILDAVKVASTHLGQTLSEEELSGYSAETETVAVETATDSVKLRTPVIPRNLNATFRISGRKIRYNNIVVDTINCVAATRNRKLRISDLLAHLPQGHISGSLLYSSQALNNVSACVDLSISNVDAAGVIQLVPQIDTIAPMIKSLKGTLGLRAALTTQIDTLFNLKEGKTEGYLRIVGRELELRDSDNLTKIMKLLQFKDKEKLHMDEFLVEARLTNKQFQVYPFLMNLDKRYIVGAEGSLYDDGSYKYHVDLLKSAFGIKLGLDLWGNEEMKHKLVRTIYTIEDFPSHTDQVEARFIEYKKKIQKF